MFSCVRLHSENAIFLLVFHIFSPIFSATKQSHSQIKTILKETEIKTKPFSIHKTIWLNWEREEEKRVIANWGKGRGRSRKREISHGRRDWSSGGRLQVASRLRRKEFDLEGGGTISRYDLEGCDLTVWSRRDGLPSAISRCKLYGVRLFGTKFYLRFCCIHCIIILFGDV